MLSVSNSFKKAIKNPNREIFGYVDIKYQDNSYSTSVAQIPSVLRAFSNDGIVKGSKILNKYATLENNYTLLDGSFMVWNENTIDENGYVSDDVFNNINDNTIIVENSSTNITTKGITIYFKENLPFSFTVIITDTDNNTYTDTITNNNSTVYQYIFDTEKYISQVELNISNVEFPNNRIRIAYIDFNLSDLYEGNELVSFDVDEELDLLVENLPINTCSININNYPSSYGGNKFDPINPKGITKYLNDNTTIEPYVGVLTETNGIEYVPMGVFYLSDWVSDVDGNVTLNGKSILSKLKGLQIKPTPSFFNAPLYINDFKTALSNSLDANFDFISYSDVFNNSYIKDAELQSYIQHLLPIFLYYKNTGSNIEEFRKFYVSRDDKITINKINQTVIDNISRLELLTDVSYMTRNRIRELSMSYSGLGVLEYSTAFDIGGYTYTLDNTENYMWVLYDKVLHLSDFTYNVVSGNAVATLIGYGNFMYCIKIVGDIGSRVTINVKSDIKASTTVTRNYSIINTNIQKGDNISINETNYYPIDREYAKKLYFELDKPYKITAKTIGDPSLEIGDTIAIQTRYTDTNNGYKNIIITKQHFSFDGGLQCNIEGVGD